MKRAFDIVVGGLLLIVLSPVLLVAAFAIVIDSGLPVFFRQERVGRDSESFRVWKFRTMVIGAERMGAGLEIEANDCASLPWESSCGERVSTSYRSSSTLSGAVFRSWVLGRRSALRSISTRRSR